MNWLLVVPGAWIIFDGAVSATYFAIFVDRSFMNWQDQTVRAVRTLAGIVVLLAGLGILGA